MSARDDLARTIAQVCYPSPRQPRRLDGDQLRLLNMYWGDTPGELFKPSGKWAYTVSLDYRNASALFVDAGVNALRAFEQACALGASGVSMTTIPKGWHLFVPAPPEGFPVMVTGGAS